MKLKFDEQKQIEHAEAGEYGKLNPRVLSPHNLIMLRRSAEKQGKWELREILLQEEARRSVL